MEEYIFEKDFLFEHNIDNVSNILLDNDFENVLSEEGVNIKGNIYLTFNTHYEDKKDYIAKTIPVDLFVALNKVDSLKELKLNITNFEYIIKDNQVHFKVFTKLLGNNEDFISFQPTKNRQLNDAMVSLLIRGEDKNNHFEFEQDFLKNVEGYLLQDDVELISTPYDNLNFKQEDIIEISSLKDDIENVENEIVNVEEENNIDDEQIEMAEKIEDVKEDITKNKEESTPIEENKKTIQDDNRQDMFIKEPSKMEIKSDTRNNNIGMSNEKELFKESYASLYFYYRLKENETLNDILTMFKLTEDDFYALNKKVEFKKGQLVKIKK